MFGERIAELRRRHGLSQQEVANLLGVTRQTVSNWECGQGAPTIDKAMALARTYHMSLDELVDPDFDADAGQPPEGPAPEPASPVASLSLKLVDDADSVRMLASDTAGAIAYEARAAKSPLGPHDFAVRDESGRRVGSLARRTTTFMGFDMTRVAIRVSGFDKVEAVRDMEQFAIAYRLDGEGLSLTSRSDATTCDIRRGESPFASIDAAGTARDGFAATFASDAPMDLAICVAMAVTLLLAIDRPGL